MKHILPFSIQRYAFLILFVLFSSIHLAGCYDDSNSSDADISEPSGKKNLSSSIILFIGDGMGEAQRQAAVFWLGDTLIMDDMPAYGYSQTYSADNDVTDSAFYPTRAIPRSMKTKTMQLNPQKLNP